MRNKLLYLIVISTILISTLPAAIPAVAQETNTYHKVSLNTGFPEADEEQSEPLCGYIPPTMDLSHLREIPVNRMRMLGALPSDWDWRTQGKVTPVKNQAPCSTCWIFGTTSVLESAVLLGESTSYDFSEQSVALCVDRSWVYLYDSTNEPCMELGNSFKASEVFIKKGAVLESCNPYSGPGLNCDGSCVCDSCPPVKKVTGYRYVTDDASDIDLIKEAVYDRPVMMAYYHNSAAEYHDATYGPIYDFYPCGETPNHLVSIIGWNDDVPHPDADHSGTGAWLVKNSWGTADSWAGGTDVSNGYFWLAYESSSTSGIAYLEYGDYDANEQLYYWDEVGLMDTIGVNAPTAWMASVFTSQQNGNLTHVDFWTTSNNAEYEIYVYDDSDLSDGLQNPLTSPQSGTCAELGYYSIPLTSPVAMTNNQQFTVAVKMTTPGYNGPIAVEYIVPGEHEPPIQAGVCFLSADGAAWDDASLVPDGYNVCLRARITSTPLTTGSISGYVFESDNVTPIEGATVMAWDIDQAERVPWKADAETTTGVDGSYSLTGLPGGSYVVASVADSHERLFYQDIRLPRYASEVTVTGGYDTDGINFGLGPGGTISGTVKNYNGSATLADVSVITQIPNIQGLFSAALTDASGNYVLDGLPYGYYFVMSPAPIKMGSGDSGYIPELWEEQPIGGSGDAIHVTSDQPDYINIDFTLEQGGIISGHVDDGSDPIPGTMVQAFDYDSLSSSWVYWGLGITNENGYYETCALPDGEYGVRAMVLAGGYADEWYDGVYHQGYADPVEVHVSDNITVNFSLEPGGSISGTIRDAVSSAALAGVSVECRRITDGPNDWHGITSDSSGNYTIGGLPYGEYEVRSPGGGRWGGGDDGYLQEYYSGGTVNVDDDESPTGVDFALEQGGSISGIVYESDGETPIEGMHVYADDYTTGQWKGGVNTDSSGNYTLAGLAEGSYRVRTCASCVGMSYIDEFYNDTYFWDSAEEIVVPASAEITGKDFTLELGYTISGHVDDGSDPIQDAQVEIIDHASVSGHWINYSGVRTDGNGDYTTSGLPAGSYAVLVRAAGYANEWYNGQHDREYAAAVTVPGDQVNIDFSLEPGGSISGHVKDSDSNPIVNLHVYASDNVTGHWMEGANTDASGNYTISGLPEGGYIVRACASCDSLPYLDEYYDNAYTWEEADSVTITPPVDHGGIDFTLEQGGTISGTIWNYNGSVPLADVSVECKRTIDGPNDWHTATADSSGDYTIQGLPFGEYEVRSPGGGRWGAGDDNYIQEYYDNGTVTYINILDATPHAGIDFTLGVGGSISGHVEDSLSNPIVNLHVYAVDNVTGEWMGGMNTDVNGDYVLAGLPGGGYNVKACASCVGMSYADEWYNNVYSQDAAETVPVNVNVNTPDINFSLDLPSDLVISEKHEEWVQEGFTYKVYFTVKNIGEGTAPSGHLVSYSIDSGPVAPEKVAVPVDLLPNETWAGNFATVVALSNSTDEITVCADADQAVAESNEDNNCQTNNFPEVDVVVSINAPDYVPEDVDFTATVDINYVEELNTAQYDIWFDPAVLRLDEITHGEIDTRTIIADPNNLEDGHWRVVQYLIPMTDNVTGSGYLAELHFHVIGALDTSSDINITDGLLVDIGLNVIPAIWVDDHVEVSVVPGDANGDGVINVIDMTKVARIILQMDPPNPAADCNQDTYINVIDMTCIARKILGLD